MSQATSPTRHPLLAGVAVIGETLDEAAGCDPDWLPAAEKADLLLGLARQG